MRGGRRSQVDAGRSQGDAGRSQGDAGRSLVDGLTQVSEDEVQRRCV